MNHYSAKKRKSDSLYDYVLTEDGKTYPVGYCHEWKELTPGVLSEEVCKDYNEDYGKFKHKYHTSGHKTEKEACNCYKEYLLDSSFQKLDQRDGQYKCQECGKFTQNLILVGIDTKFAFHLCEEHAKPRFAAKYFEISSIASS